MSYTILVFLIHMVVFATMFIETQGFSINLIPINSVLFPKNLTLEETHQRLMELSRNRALYLKSTMEASNYSINTIQPSIRRHPSSLYLTQMSIGSNQYSPYLQVDSGTEDTWVQCEGCRTCFALRGGNFKYKESQSNHHLPCDHALCVPRLCDAHNSYCLYKNSYLDGGSTEGWVLSDFFAFSAKNQAGKLRFRLAFGCGIVNRKLYWGATDGPSNPIAGIFGLGGGQRSFLSQLQTETKMRLSYCLPSWNIDKGSQTLLHFGSDAEITGSSPLKVQTTNLVMSNRYYVTMLGISIEGTRLKIDPSVFKFNNFRGTGGFQIDTGSSYSVLIKSAYKIFRREMVLFLKQKNGWIPKRRQQVKFSGFDLCYALPRGKNYSLPSVTYHFGGGVHFVMDSDVVFRPFSTLLCMGIIGFDGASILGAFQQVNYRFLFDLKQSTVSFVPEIPCKTN